MPSARDDRILVGGLLVALSLVLAYYQLYNYGLATASLFQLFLTLLLAGITLLGITILILGMLMGEKA